MHFPSFLLSLGLFAFILTGQEYRLSSESLTRGVNVPTGRIEIFEFNESKIYPETARRCWLYIPAPNLRL